MPVQVVRIMSALPDQCRRSSRAAQRVEAGSGSATVAPRPAVRRFHREHADQGGNADAAEAPRPKIWAMKSGDAGRSEGAAKPSVVEPAGHREENTLGPAVGTFPNKRQCKPGIEERETKASLMAGCAPC